MRLPPLRQAVFLSRPNRFTAMVEKGGRVLPVHVPSSGRLHELLFPGNEVWIEEIKARGGKNRATAGALHLARGGTDLVCINTSLTNLLAVEAWRKGFLPELETYEECRREVRAGESRFDLEFTGAGGSCLAEVKCVTLVREGLALFPDAPTGRGRRHLEHLAELAGIGRAAAVIFVIQHPAGRRFAPNAERDPLFAQALRAALSAGVRVMALRCLVEAGEVAVAERVPLA